MKLKKILLSSMVIISLSMAGCNSGNNNTNIELNTKTVNEVSNNVEVEQNVANTKGDEEIDIKSSGVLLGIKKTKLMDNEPNDYETLWIYNDGNNVSVKNGEGFITTPYGSEFYKLENSIFDEKKFFDTANDKSEEASLNNYEYKYHYIDTVSYPISGSKKPVEYKKADDEGAWPIQTKKDNILFVGNKYALINRDNFETGGGTFKAAWYSNEMYEIKYLNEGYKVQKKQISDLLKIDDNIIEELKEKYNKDLTDENNSNGGLMELKQEINTEDIYILRKEGKWQAALPLNEIYVHNGNGSYSVRLKELIYVDAEISKELTTYDELGISFEELKREIPNIKDAVYAPDDSMLCVITDDRIDVYLNPKEDLKEVDLSINIDKENIIVSNQWATGEYADKWNELLKNYLK